MSDLAKSATGILGLDEVLRGGLPTGRPSLVFGGPGCGKTMLAMEFLCRGAVEYGEPGFFLSFDEQVEDLISDFTSCDFRMSQALADHRLRIEYIPAPDSRATQAGEFTLDALLVRLDRWTNEIGAKRLVLDSLDALFARFSDSLNLRHELSRVIQWTKQRGLTSIITSELHDGDPARHTMQEFASDCVILMDHRVSNQISKRRLRTIKYRGSSHGADEYPFLINQEGINVFPITSVGLESDAPESYVSSGVEGLDAMLADKGFYRGSSILVSGGAGTGKTTLAVSLALSTCRAGERSLYLSFEESTSQIVRNMASVGLDLKSCIKEGLLRISPMRPSFFGLEEHLVRIHKIIYDFKPASLIMDPITSFLPVGDQSEVRSMLTRLLDFCKMKQINVLMTSLTPGGASADLSQTEVSSIVDTWLIISYQLDKSERRRFISVHKARGLAHSNSVGLLIMSERGPQVEPLAKVPSAGGS